MRLDIGLMTFDLPAVAEYARRAEDLGFGAIWSAETRHDPFLPLAVAASATTRIGLGTAIALAFPRSPMILAHIDADQGVLWCRIGAPDEASRNVRLIAMHRATAVE